MKPGLPEAGSACTFLRLCKSTPVSPEPGPGRACTALRALTNRQQERNQGCEGFFNIGGEQASREKDVSSRKLDITCQCDHLHIGES